MLSTASAAVKGAAEAPLARIASTIPAQAASLAETQQTGLIGCVTRDSSCHGLDRVARDDEVCQQQSCKDGCLKDGACNHATHEEDCVRDLDSVWCLPCSKELWDICYVGAYCFANCHSGCCSSECGTCPSPPFAMRQSGQDCASCAMVPTICDECFPRSLCSTSYNPQHGQPDTRGETGCATEPPTTGETAPSTTNDAEPSTTGETAPSTTSETGPSTSSETEISTTRETEPSTSSEIATSTANEGADEDADFSGASFRGNLGVGLLVVVAGLSLLV